MAITTVKEQDTNQSLISIWKKQGYDIDLIVSKELELQENLKNISESLNKLLSDLNKLDSAISQLKVLKDIIKRNKEAFGK